MPGQRPLLAMGFIGSLGITFEVLACAVPAGSSNFWPLIIYVVYLLVPLPFMISRRIVKDTMVGTNEVGKAKTRDLMLFATAGLMTSSFALPIVLARTPPDAPIIKPISCVLVEIGNCLCYTTVALFCIYFKPLQGF